MNMEVNWGEPLFRYENRLSTISATIREIDDLVLVADGESLDADDFPDHVRETFTAIINRAAETLNLRPGDIMAMLITGTNSEGNPVQIGIPFRNVDELTADIVLNQIGHAMPSSQSLSMNMRVKFSGVWQDVGPVGAKSQILARFSGHHRAVVSIHPRFDPFKDECMYQFIAIGLAALKRRGGMFSPGVQALLEGVGIFESSYLKLTTGANVSKFNRRHEIAMELKSLLTEEQQTLPFEKILECYEHLFEVHFVIYDIVDRLSVWYPKFEDLPREPDQVGNEIFGLLERGDVSHIDYIVKPEALAQGEEAGRVCPFCYSLYTRSRVCRNEDCASGRRVKCRRCHTCVGVCHTCGTQDCGKFTVAVDPEDEEYNEVTALREKKFCRSCRRDFFSLRCMELHQNVCLEMQSTTCGSCGKSDHRGLKCHEVRCLMCSDKLHRDSLQEHVCYMKRDKLKKPKTCYWTYDFEACLDENNRHVIYLATAWPVYPVLFHHRMNEYTYTTPAKYPNQPVFIFWGLDGVKNFFNFLKEEFLHGTEFFAHNAGKYDAIFIEKYMAEMNGMLPSKLQRGTKIMQMKYEENEITFKDSLCFISSSLRSMASNFAVDELRKGFFPHKVMTVDFLRQAETLGYRVPRPSREVWESDFRRGKEGREEKAELDRFLEEFYAEDTAWDLKKDAIEYCISDTILLGEVLKIFRERCMSLAKDIPGNDKGPDFDVLQSVTLPSAVMNLFMSTCLPEKTLTVVDRYPQLMRKKAVEWVLLQCSRKRIQLQTLDFFPLVYDKQITAFAENHMFFFTPCYDNGCPKCFPSQHRNLRVDKPFFYLFKELKEKLTVLRQYAFEHGYTLDVIWEHEFDKLKRTKEVSKWFNDNENFLTDWIPLDPRDSYKGGVSEMYKIVHPHPFSMADFVSQYPTSMLGFSFDPENGEMIEWPFPTGRVEISILPEVEQVVNTTKLGIVKCRILPPKRLYAPFLGYKAESRLVPRSYECLYGLCRVCMDERRNSTCPHTDDARSFTGTWTIAEIQYALTLGYSVLHVTELWEYEGKSNTIFRNFIVPFIRAKIVAKRQGIVDEEGQFTEQGVQVADYIGLLTGKRAVPEDFHDSPVDRNVSKLKINSVYGKFGQRAVWPCCSSFTTSQEDIERCNVLIADSSCSIQSIDLIPLTFGVGEEKKEDLIAIIAYEKNYPTSKGDSKKNDMIAAHITAYGRIMLNRVIQRLGNSIMYCDTDSVSHSHFDHPPYQKGFRIGDLEFELPLADNWVANGRKSYLYKKPDGSTVCKQKGVSLKVSMEQTFTVENMHNMIMGTFKLLDTLQEEGMTLDEALKMIRKLRDTEDRPSLDVLQSLFVTKRNALLGDKISLTQIKKTRFLLEALKRRVDPKEGMIDTLPFGYVDE